MLAPRGPGAILMALVVVACFLEGSLATSAAIDRKPSPAAAAAAPAAATNKVPAAAVPVAGDKTKQPAGSLTAPSASSKAAAPVPAAAPKETQKSAPAPVVAPVAQAAAKPAAAPVATPAAKPAAAAPVVAPAAKRVVAPAAKPAAAPVVAPAAKSAAVPVVAPAAKPAAAPVVAPAAKPAAVPVVAPAAKPAAVLVVAPAAKPAAVPVVASAAKPAAAPVVAPVSQPVSVPAAVTQQPQTSGGESPPIRLYLVATYSPEVTPPGNGVKLIADAILTKHVDCVQEAAVAVTARPFGSHHRERPKTSTKVVHGHAPAPSPSADDADDGYGDGVMLPMIQSNLKGVKQQQQLKQQTLSASNQATAASAMSVPPEAIAVAKDPPPASQCRGSYTLSSGLYSLLAASVEGADWATWSCLAYKTSVKAAGGIANVTAVEMYSPGAVELENGFTYTCIAYYPKATSATTAAAKVKDWDSSVADAAQAAANAAAAAGCKAVKYKQPARGTPPPPIHIQGNRLTAGGKPLTIRGLNWFGFNVPMGVVDGLWAGGTDLATDFGKIAYQIKLLGYNAVRLPYTHKNVQNTEVSNVIRDCAPTTEDDLAKRLTDPNLWEQFKNKQVPANPSPLANGPGGSCNTYLPSTSNMDRFLFVVQQFIAQGLYVILDYQPMGTEDHAYDVKKFVTQWALVWKQFTCLPNFGSDMAGRLFVDVMNEPDSMGIRWEANNDRPGAQQLYLGTADAIWKMTPNQVMFMFEGTGQNMMGLSWGNGFVTDQNVIQSRGLSDANPFFQRLINRPYVKQVVLTPHVYPPTITGATFLGADLWDQSRTAFGYLQGPGYCGAPSKQTERGMASTAIAVTASLLSKLTSSSFMSSVLDAEGNVVGNLKDATTTSNKKAEKKSCTVFPVVIGETGSAYTSATDKTWLNDFAEFITASGGASSYNSVPMAGWLWWAYNENSGDTGGIVMNQWQDINWEKMRYMANKLGLTAWHADAPNKVLPPPKPPVKPPVKPPSPSPKPPTNPPGARPPAPKPPATRPPAPQPPATKPPATKPPAPKPPGFRPPAPRPPVVRPPAPKPPTARPLPPVQPAPSVPFPHRPRKPKHPRPPRSGTPGFGRVPGGGRGPPLFGPGGSFNRPVPGGGQGPRGDAPWQRDAPWRDMPNEENNFVEAPQQRGGSWMPPSRDPRFRGSMRPDRPDEDSFPRDGPRGPIREFPSTRGRDPRWGGDEDRRWSGGWEQQRSDGAREVKTSYGGDQPVAGGGAHKGGSGWSDYAAKDPYKAQKIADYWYGDSDSSGHDQHEDHHKYSGDEHDEGPGHKNFHLPSTIPIDGYEHDQHEEHEHYDGDDSPYRHREDDEDEEHYHGHDEDHKDDPDSPYYEKPAPSKRKLDGPAVKSPEHEAPKGEDKDKEKDEEHKKPKRKTKKRKHYKSLDDKTSDHTVAAPPSKQGNSPSSDTNTKEQPCISLDEFKTPSGTYKFIPPAKRKNLCKTPDAAALIPDVQKNDTSTANPPAPKDANAGGKDSKTKEAEKPYWARKAFDGKELEQQDKEEPVREHKGKDDDREQHKRAADEEEDEEEEEEGDEEDEQHAQEEEEDDDDHKPHRPSAEEEHDEGKGHGGGSSAEDKHKAEQEEEEARYPLPIVREDFGFKIPGNVEDNFWLKANKEGLLYMPKWDPVIARDYHPKTDRAGNKGLDVEVYMPKDNEDSSAHSERSDRPRGAVDDEYLRDRQAVSMALSPSGKQQESVSTFSSKAVGSGNKGANTKATTSGAVAQNGNLPSDAPLYWASQGGKMLSVYPEDVPAYKSVAGIAGSVGGGKATSFAAFVRPHMEAGKRGQSPAVTAVHVASAST